MPKRPIAVYIEQPIFNRLLEAKAKRAELSPPGWKSISSYAEHLIEEGLKLEERKLKEEMVKRTAEGKKS
jgi:hypothetical protein